MAETTSNSLAIIELVAVSASDTWKLEVSAGMLTSEPLNAGEELWIGAKETEERVRRFLVSLSEGLLRISIFRVGELLSKNTIQCRSLNHHSLAPSRFLKTS